MIQYTSGKSNIFLPEGEYPAIISRAEIASVKGKEKLVIDFTVPFENENVTRTEFVLCETWLPLFTDLIEATGRTPDKDGGTFDESELVGCEGTLTIVHTAGTGNNEGKIFCNAERFLVKKKAA